MTAPDWRERAEATLRTVETALGGSIESGARQLATEAYLAGVLEMQQAVLEALRGSSYWAGKEELVDIVEALMQEKP